MPDTSTKLTRRHKLFLASLATVSLSLGAAGVVSAAQNQSTPTSSVTTPAQEADGVDCQNGIDPSGAQCDGGPSANAANDPAEGDTGTETEAAEGAASSDEVNGVDCENGIDATTGAECDGGPSANPQDGADDATETSTESVSK